jgi:hypothetical protein
MAQIFLGDAGEDIASPFFDKRGSFYYVSRSTGEIYTISDYSTQSIRVWGNSEGQPSGANMDDDDNMYVADFAHAAIVSVSSRGFNLIVSEYENKLFKVCVCSV